MEKEEWVLVCFLVFLVFLVCVWFVFFPRKIWFLVFFQNRRLWPQAFKRVLTDRAERRSLGANPAFALPAYSAQQLVLLRLFAFFFNYTGLQCIEKTRRCIFSCVCVFLFFFKYGFWFFFKT